VCEAESQSISNSSFSQQLQTPQMVKPAGDGRAADGETAEVISDSQCMCRMLAWYCEGSHQMDETSQTLVI
jgi:hypothetical protein